MHQSSLHNMQVVRNEYLVDLPNGLTVLDVGGRGLKGDRSYGTVFADLSPNYLIADIVDGDGVSHIMPGPYELPFATNSIDLIVSGQMLEHCKNPFRSVAEMKRVVKPNGYLALIAPSTGPRHDVIDCWRFLEDSFKAIAEEVELDLVADWIDNQSGLQGQDRWNDHVFVGKKRA